MIKVAIADDHGLMREGIASMLENVPDITVVGTVQGGEEAVNLTNKIQPDVFLMDIKMRGMTGIEAARWITDINPNIRIILISAEANKEFIAAGIKAGIAGYVLKDIDKEALINAIRTVIKGERYFSPDVMTIVFQDFYAQEKVEKIPGAREIKTDLTKRELEVLTLIAHGKSLKQIADELFINIKTVETHKLNIQGKLNLTNTAQLVRYAIENKIINLG
ncbi:response regulator [Ohtaekwangia koreensis]|jgi:DNA-binding NarL/FixJ family response regulator|uniref:Two component transcriptional regulator, LuxR family n=1 Tax=Ohtaekwangia koreensis TaxID=688867 RepID=A0A1T5K3A4_9BACT|nr:response regulator transcription factor [Ohtaekwangia koreensis]SKC58113.1 two component transcriptional regulator, LuxR family [Ohtaekwangia koreensis]